MTVWSSFLIVTIWFLNLMDDTNSDKWINPAQSYCIKSIGVVILIP